jgi:hypothetical protein
LEDFNAVFSKPWKISSFLFQALEKRRGSLVSRQGGIPLVKAAWLPYAATVTGIFKLHNLSVVEEQRAPGGHPEAISYLIFSEMRDTDE